MARPRALPLVLIVLASIAAAAAPRAAAQGIIKEPAGAEDVTVVDTSVKDGGYQPGQEVEGYLHIKALASKKGAHLEDAAASIVSQNANAASALTSAVGKPASNDPIAAQNVLWTRNLYPYLGYYNGPVLAGPIKVYLVYYGNWTANQKKIIEAFVGALGKTNCYPKGQNSVQGWWDITAHYYFDALRERVSSDVVLGKTAFDSGSRLPAGLPFNSLTPTDIQHILARALRAGNLGLADPGGAYFVLTSPDVYVEQFCANLCSYHTHAHFGLAGGVRLAYAFIGNPASQCPNYCSYQYYDASWQGPNNDLGADAVVDQLAHTLTEIATNPFQGAHSPAGWVVAGSAIENADLCEYDYGTTRGNSPHEYNMVGPNGMNFMVQRNFNRRNNSCVMMDRTPTSNLCA